MALVIKKTRPQRYSFTEGAMEDLEALIGDVSPMQAREMMKKSTPIKHKLGTRRYKELVFDLKEDIVLRVSHINASVRGRDAVNLCWACMDTGKIPVYDMCPACNGVGCSECENGYILNQIPCQNPHCRHFYNTEKQPRSFHRKKSFDKRR